MIKYDRLFELLKTLKRPSTAWLRGKGIHPRTVDKLKKNQHLDTRTIDALCKLLHVQPGEIMEYVDDEE